MLFSSITFLYVFLPAVLLVYFAVPSRAKNYVLLIASLIFYFYGEPIYTVLLLFSSLSDFLHSLIIEKRRGTKYAKYALISSIIINVAMLGVFKYADFFIGAFNSAFGASAPLLGLPLPIGISFFTFQTMSYTIDVYRGRVKAQRSFSALATYVCLFPQLIAGPIVRYSDVADELTCRKSDMNSIAWGIRRFAFGLGKKVIIANSCGELCEIFRQSSDKSVLFFWIYAAAFTLQIYFDFSGYSDMAIGLGRMFGFSFPENFNYPYVSRSITEFWRRWHMTLGGWFRDYVYIPLGGSHTSKWRWLINICIVWLLTGLWHGAEWNFVIWGAMFGLLLVIEKLWLLRALKKCVGVISHIYVMFFVTVSFVIFNANGITGALFDLSGMFGLLDLPASSFDALYYLRSYAVLLCIAVIGATPLPKRLYERLARTAVCKRVLYVLEPLAVAALVLITTAYLVDGSFNPFLYFRF